MKVRWDHEGTGLIYTEIEDYDSNLEYLNIPSINASSILWKKIFILDCIGFKIKHLGYILFCLMIDLHVP